MLANVITAGSVAVIDSTSICSAIDTCFIASKLLYIFENATFCSELIFA